MLFVHGANCALNWIHSFKLSDNQVVDNLSGKVRVDVTLLNSFKISFEAVPSVEELADVPTNVVVHHKSSSWVMTDEFFNI